MKRLLTMIATAMLICGCAADGILHTETDDELRVGAQLVTELATLERPADVDSALWQALTAELERVVQAGTRASQTPLHAASQADPLTFGPFLAARCEVWHVERRLEFYHSMPGDYDGNNEVNAADLVPLAQHFGRSSQPKNLFPAGSIEAVVDGDNNGEINIGDVTPIGQHFKERLLAYNIYGSTDLANYPHYAEAAILPPLLILDSFDPQLSSGEHGTITVELPEERVDFYWLRRLTTAGEGPPSRLATRGDAGTHEVPFYREKWTQLSYDAQSGEVFWRNWLSGDGNGDSAINVMDVTVIGANFGAELGPLYGLAAWEAAGLQPIDADMNRDGIVDARDIFVVESFIGMGYDGYRLYHSENLADIPAHPWAEESVAEVHYGEMQFDGGVFALGPGATGYLWLRAYRGDEVGPVSAMIQL